MVRYVSTAQGISDQLSSVGPHHYGYIFNQPGTPGTLVHPASAVYRKTTPRGYRSDFISPSNGTAAPGNEVEFEVRSCNGYLIGAAVDVTLPLITGKAVGAEASLTDNTVWMNDAGFAMIEWCEVHFGSCSDKPREYGNFWHILHKHLDPEDQLNESVFELPFNKRVAACTRPVPLHVPLMFDFFDHPTKALFMPNHLSTPLVFRFKFRTNADLVELAGDYEINGAPDESGDPAVSAGLTATVPETYVNLRLRLDYMHLSNADTEAAKTMTRQLVLRFRERATKTVTAGLADLRFELTANRTVDQLWIVPNVTQIQDGRSFGPNYLDHSGPPVASLTHASTPTWVLGDPFSCATFSINNNELWSERFNYLVDTTKAQSLESNPREETDRVPFIPLDRYALHHPGAALYLGAQVGRYVDILFGECDGVPGHGSWPGTIELYYTTIRILKEQGGAAVLSN